MTSDSSDGVAEKMRRHHEHVVEAAVEARVALVVYTSIVDAAIYLGFRPCAGIAHVPLLADGGLVTRADYHAGSGLVLDLRGPPLAVPEAPDRRAA